MRSVTWWLAWAAIGPACSSTAPQRPDAADLVDATTVDVNPHDSRTPMDLRAQDVSLLFPLPAGATTLAALPELRTPTHALLRLEQFEVVASDFTEGLSTQGNFDALRWVAMRIDPCGDIVGCLPVRLVFQPASTTDAAIHAFYALDAARVRALVVALANLREQHAPALPAADDWSIHPALESGSAYRDDVVTLVRSYISADDLSRVAAFGFPGSFPDPDGNQQWVFRSAQRVGSAWEAEPLRDGVVETMQLFDTNAFIDPTTRMARTVTVSSPTACEVAYSSSFDGALVPNGTLDLPTACGDETAATDLVRAARRLLDPAVTSTRSTDCASCHAAPVFARTLVERFPNSVDDGAMPAMLGPPIAGITRAFGYHGVAPVVSPRVRSETAAALATFESMLP